jgi:hypothetical protein
MTNDGSPRLHCPRCGRGELVDISFDAGPPSDAPADTGVPEQGTDTRQVESYSCGHQVLGARLSQADPHHLDVERRTSEDTVAPVDAGMAR